MTIALNRQTILKADEMPIWSIVSPTKPVQTNKKSSGSELVKISHFQGPCLPPCRHGILQGIFTAHERPCCHSNLHICLQRQVLSTGHSNTAMVSFWRYRSTYIYVRYLMLQSAVLKYEKTLCHFSFQESIWTFLELVGFSNLLVLPGFPPHGLYPSPLKNCPFGWLSKFFAKPELLVASPTSPISPISQFCLQNAFPCGAMPQNLICGSIVNCHCHCHWQWQFNCTGFQSLPLFILCSAAALGWGKEKRNPGNVFRRFLKGGGTRPRCFLQKFNS